MTLKIFFTACVALLIPFFCDGQEQLTEDDRARETIASTTAWINGGDRTVVNYRNRGLAYHQLQSFELAREDFTNALKIDSLNADLFNLRASVSYDMGKYEESIVDYDKAISLDIGNLSLYVARGAAKAKLGRMQSAEDDYLHVLKIDSLNELAQFNKAILYWNDPIKQKSTLSDFARLLRHYPTAEYYYNRGEYYLKSKNYELALKDLTRATNLEKDNPTYQIEKGFCLGMLGKYTEAKLAFTIAQKLDDQNPELYWRRGLWRSHNREKALACADFKKAASLGLQLDELLSKCQ